MKLRFHLSFIILFQALLSFGISTSVLVQDQQGFGVAYARITLEVLGQPQATKSCYQTNEEGIADLVLEENSIISIYAFGYLNVKDTIYIHQVQKMPLVFHLEDKVIVLNEIVLTAQIDETNPEHAMQVIKIIDKEQIFTQGAVTLKDVMQTQQNTRLGQDQILGSSMSIMGVSGQNVKILVDGVPVIGRQGGNIDLSQINLSNVERIEIIEGPLSVNYGSDALAGTINIITKKSQKQDVSLEAKTFYESVGQYNASVNAGFNLKAAHLSVEGGRNFFQGWSMLDTSRFKEWKPKEQYFANFNYVKYSDLGDFRFKSTYFDEYILNRGAPREPFYIKAFDDTYKTKRMDNSLSYSKINKKRGRIEALVAYNYYLRNKNTYNIDLTTLESELTPDKTLQDTSGFDLLMSRGTYNIAKDSAKLKYQIGYDVNRESAIGARIASGQQHIYDLATFANVEWKLSQNLLVKPGLRLAYNSAYNAPIVPSLHIKWANQKYTIRASYARGFRAPSIKDLYFDFVDVNHNIQGNKELQAEYSNNYQVNTERKIKLKKSSDLTVKLGGFYNDIDNLITLAQVPGSTSYSYQNIEIYKTLGLQNLNTIKLKNSNLALGFSYIGKYNQVSSQQSDGRFYYYPEFTLNVNHNFEKPKLKLSIYGKYQGKLINTFINDKDEIYTGFIDAYTYADASLSRSFNKEKLQVATGVKNIFDITSVRSSSETGSHNSSSSSTPVSYGRTFFLSLTYNWTK
jgi:outer membrane receptor for ferrienterochelin and colicins